MYCYALHLFECHLFSPITLKIGDKVRLNELLRACLHENSFLRKTSIKLSSLKLLHCNFEAISLWVHCSVFSLFLFIKAWNLQTSMVVTIKTSTLWWWLLKNLLKIMEDATVGIWKSRDCYNFFYYKKLHFPFNKCFIFNIFLGGAQTSICHFFHLSIHPSVHPYVCPSIYHPPYLRNQASSDHNFCYTCLKW